jgi:hypothetical protein
MESPESRYGRSDSPSTHTSIRLRLMHQLRRAVLLVSAISFLVLLRNPAWGAIPPGVWLMDSRVAVEIYACNDFLCGRILWRIIPRDPEGQ